MKSPIAGVAPSTFEEVTVMIVWPSLAASSVGRWWGRRYMNNFGFRLFGVPITVGRIVALISIPFILPPYFLTLLPGLMWLPKIGPLPGLFVANPWCRHYRLTNRRVIVHQGLRGKEERSVSLDRFDSIEIEVLPGQEWYHAGDLIFRVGPVETFRLAGVPRPEPFRQTCLKAHQSYVGVQAAREQLVAV